MKSFRAVIFWISILIASGTSAESVFTPDKEATLIGTFISLAVKSDVDGKLVEIWALKSDAPVSLGVDDGGWGPARKEKFIQLTTVNGFKMLHSKQNVRFDSISNLSRFVGMRVKMLGVLFNRSNGHQYEKILMDLKQITILNLKQTSSLPSK